MAERAKEDVSISRQEFEAFIAENQQLMGCCEKLLARVKSLQEALAAADQQVKLVDETIRKARPTMTKLIKESDRLLSGS